MHTVYVHGLQHILERLPRSVSRVVYASSTSVYGQVAGNGSTKTLRPNRS